jgi:toxin ParE1/3/4
VKVIVKEAAEDDILRQIEWYAERGFPDVARRFQAATQIAFQTLATMPEAGAPKRIENPILAGLRSWPIKGFDEFRVYYLAQPREVAIVRVLHGKRDVLAVLENRAAEES